MISLFIRESVGWLMRLKEWKRKVEPVENVELLHKEFDAGGHEQVGQVVAVDLITRNGDNYYFDFQTHW